MSKKSRFAVLMVVVLLMVTGVEAAFAGSPIGYNFEIVNEAPPVEEMHSAMAYNPERQEYLVVWYNDRPGNDDIRARRYNKRGQPMGGPFYISAGPGADRRDPSVAYAQGQNQYLVVWQHQEAASGFSIHGRRVSGTGQVLDGNDLIIRSAGFNLYSPANSQVEYALKVQRYLVVWQEPFHPTITTDIKGQAIKLDGQPDGSDFVIDPDPGGQGRRKPDLAYNRARNEFLVVWEQEAGGGDENIHGKRVKMAGGAGPLGNPIDIMVDAKEQWDPAVAALPQPAGMGQYMVVWRHRHTATDSDIHGKIVKGDGTAEPGFVVSQWNENEISPDVASSELAKRYLVTWTHEHTTLNVMESIQGQEVSMTRELVGPALSCGGLHADSSAVAGGPMGDFMITFDDTAFGTSRGIYGQLWGTRMYVPVLFK